MASSSDALLERVLARVEELETRVAGLEADNTALREENTALREENAALKRENAQLKRRVGLDSTNSSMPPSCDRPGTRPAGTRSLRTRSGKRPGKQPGAGGTSLAQVADPDHVIDHYPAACSGCHRKLEAARPAGVRRCQVFDLPEPAGLQVTEHRYHRLRCSCGATTAPAPVAGAAAPTAYGPRISAVGAYLMSAHHLPVERTAEILSDVCTAEVSTGWLASLPAKAHHRLEGFQTALKTAIAASKVVHADETGARVAGTGHWGHVAGTGTLTFYGVHPSRGREAMTHLGVLPAFGGTLVTDALASYDIYGGAHQLCCAHLLRELQALIDFEPEHAAWARNMRQVLLKARDLAEQARIQGAAALGDQERADIRAAYRRVVTFARAGPHHRLIERLDKRRDDYLRFTTDLAVPFTSNAAERDVRMVKLQVKMSGGWRTPDGARYFCRIRSFISTARKQGHAVLAKLTELFAGNVWLPSTT